MAPHSHSLVSNNNNGAVSTQAATGLGPLPNTGSIFSSLPPLALSSVASDGGAPGSAASSSPVSASSSKGSKAARKKKKQKKTSNSKRKQTQQQRDQAKVDEDRKSLDRLWPTAEVKHWPDSLVEAVVEVHFCSEDRAYEHTLSLSGHGLELEP